MRAVRGLAAATICVALAGSGCGFQKVIPYLYGLTGELDVENGEAATHWIDEMELQLLEPDPDIAEGEEYAESRHNRDPNESEHFWGLRPGVWEVMLVWSDGTVGYAHVRVRPGETANLELTY